MRVLDDDRGAVTVEAALALCSLVAVMVMVIAAVSAASAHLRCLDAAREVARLVSRGEPQRAREIAAEVAPRGATVDVQVIGDEVHARVTAAAVPGIPALSLVGDAVGLMEPAALLSAEGPPDPASDDTGADADVDAGGTVGAGSAGEVDPTAPEPGAAMPPTDASPPATAPAGTEAPP